MLKGAERMMSLYKNWSSSEDSPRVCELTKKWIWVIFTLLKNLKKPKANPNPNPNPQPQNPKPQNPKPQNPRHFASAGQWHKHKPKTLPSPRKGPKTSQPMRFEHFPDVWCERGWSRWKARALKWGYSPSLTLELLSLVTFEFFMHLLTHVYSLLISQHVMKFQDLTLDFSIYADIPTCHPCFHHVCSSLSKQ